MTKPKNPNFTRSDQAEATKAQFAELLAEGAHPNDAAVQLGFVPQYGRVLLAKIRRELGAQAV